jgi:hypothetical protein
VYTCNMKYRTTAKALTVLSSESPDVSTLGRRLLAMCPEPLTVYEVVKRLHNTHEYWATSEKVFIELMARLLRHGYLEAVPDAADLAPATPVVERRKSKRWQRKHGR